jgi:hypothetical protein
MVLEEEGMFLESLGLLSLMLGMKVRSGCIDRPSLARIHMFYERQIIQDPAPEFFAPMCTNHHTNRLLEYISSIQNGSH